MAKKRTSFALSETTLAMLKMLAENDNRSQAQILESLVSKAYMVMGYVAEGKFSTEEDARIGLDVSGYWGKWNKAKIAVASKMGWQPTLPAFWDAVRLYFLELGGCWLAEKA